MSGRLHNQRLLHNESWSIYSLTHLHKKIHLHFNRMHAQLLNSMEHWCLSSRPLNTYNGRHFSTSHTKNRVWYVNKAWSVTDSAFFLRKVNIPLYFLRVISLIVGGWKFHTLLRKVKNMKDIILYHAIKKIMTKQ